MYPRCPVVITKPIGETDVTKILERFLPREKARCGDLSLYRRAMVHRSAATRGSPGTRGLSGKVSLQPKGGSCGSYERLEFLGDAVLGLVTASYLFERYPNEDEGFMTRMRTKLINGKMLAELCLKHTTLPGFVVASSAHLRPPTEDENTDTKPGACATRSVLEDVFEAFLGAMFIDLGFDAVRCWLVGFLEENVDFADLVSHQDSVKAVLNRHCMRNLGFLPETQELSGPSSPAGAVVRLVTPNGTVISTGSGASRKEAEDVAVRRALSYYSVPGRW